MGTIFVFAESRLNWDNPLLAAYISDRIVLERYSAIHTMEILPGLTWASCTAISIVSSHLSHVVADPWCWQVILYTAWACIYNVFVHPLARYPGPLLARISPVGSLKHSLDTSDWSGYRYIASGGFSEDGGHLMSTSCIWNMVSYLHDHGNQSWQLIGPIVRIMPNELSFTEPQAWKDIYGHRQGHPQFHKDRTSSWGTTFVQNLGNWRTNIR